jgi:Mg-chelatase subunit ChlD/methionine-rich copper-binding protein CopC
MSAWADEGSIEQIYVNLPEVTVYSSGITADGAEAYLGNRKLTLQNEIPFEQSGQPIYYYILLDVSNSMPEKYFDAIKTSIADFDQSLSGQDCMALYTFGEEVVLQLEEDHDKTETAGIIDAIDNTDNRTLLFEAVKRAADRASQVSSEDCTRRVLIVISDGEDITDGGTGATEALEKLKETGLPVYACAITDTKRENINNFGEFARQSGGTLTTFGEADAEQLLENVAGTMKNYDVLQFTAEDNQITNAREMFSLKDAQNQTVTREVLVNRHIEDTVSPEIISLECLNEKQIAIIFSEKVQGADVAASYSVRHDGVLIPVTGVSIDHAENPVYVLTFQDVLEAGEYEVSCSGVSDVSMEKNAVSGTRSFRVEGEAEEAEPETTNPLKKLLWIIPAAVAVLFALIGVILMKKKKSKVNHIQRDSFHAKAQEVHQHVVMKEPARKDFYARIQVNGSRPEELKLTIESSFIVGRSRICNLYFDDTRMSRQHYALEWDGTDFYVSDLETTNGTKVNGIPLTGRRKLAQNDRISAGAVEMTIRW